MYLALRGVLAYIPFWFAKNAMNKANLFYNLSTHIQGLLKLPIFYVQIFFSCEIGTQTHRCIRTPVSGIKNIPKNPFPVLMATVAIFGY